MPREWILPTLRSVGIALIDGDGLVVTLHSAQCRPLHGEPDGHLSLIAKQRVDYVCLCAY